MCKNRSFERFAYLLWILKKSCLFSEKEFFHHICIYKQRPFQSFYGSVPILHGHAYCIPQNSFYVWPVCVKASNPICKLQSLRNLRLWKYFYGTYKEWKRTTLVIPSIETILVWRSIYMAKLLKNVFKNYSYLTLFK